MQKGRLWNWNSLFCLTFFSFCWPLCWRKWVSKSRLRNWIFWKKKWENLLPSLSPFNTFCAYVVPGFGNKKGLSWKQNFHYSIINERLHILLEDPIGFIFSLLAYIVYICHSNQISVTRRAWRSLRLYVFQQQNKSTFHKLAWQWVMPPPTLWQLNSLKRKNENLLYMCAKEREKEKLGKGLKIEWWIDLKWFQNHDFQYFSTFISGV